MQEFVFLYRVQLLHHFFMASSAISAMQYFMQAYRDSLQLFYLVFAYLISFTLKNGDHLKISYLQDWDVQVEFHLFILQLVTNHYRGIVLNHNYHIMLQWQWLICNNS